MFEDVAMLDVRRRFWILALAAPAAAQSPPMKPRAAKLPPLIVKMPDGSGCSLAAHGGGAWLRATERSIEADDGRVRRRFDLPPGVRWVFEDRQPATVGVFKGARDHWRSGLQTFGKVSLVRGNETLFSLESSAGELRTGGAWAAGAAAQLTQMGFLGGAGADFASAIAVGPGGDVFIAGTTASTEATFPATGGPDITYNGATLVNNGDAFIAKLDPTCSTILFAGFIGGSGNDGAIALAVDAQNRAVLGGQTTSTPADGFPATVGPGIGFLGGGLDAWIARVSADGSALDYCGYLGGEGGDERVAAIAVAPNGDAYFAGHTDSAGEPVAAGHGLKSINSGGTDAFVGAVNSDGAALKFSAFLGGDDTDFATGIALGPNGRVYITGVTASHPKTFPVLVGPGRKFRGEFDAFVASFDPPAGSGPPVLRYCGYVGGAKLDAAGSIAVDDAGNAYICGYTYSDESTFPVKLGPHRKHSGGPNSVEYDAFVARVAASGKRLDYCGYLGGSGFDRANEIALGPAGSLFVCGETSSKPDGAIPFPAGGGIASTSGAFSDAFLAECALDGGGVLAAATLGGDGVDAAQSCAVGPGQTVHVCGQTQSTDTSLPVVVGPDATANGGYDGFIASYNFGSPAGDGSLRLGVTSASMRRGAKPNSDALTFSGPFTPSGEAAADASDLTRNDFIVTFGPVSSPTTIVLAAGAPQVQLVGSADHVARAIFRTPPGAVPRVVVTVDFQQRGFRAALSGASIPQGAEDEDFECTLNAGARTGRFRAPWRTAPSGTLRMP